MTEAALNAGKHVWLEKPMAVTLEDAQAMTDLAAANPSLVTLLGYNYVRSPAIQSACNIIAAGEIGELKTFRGVYDEDFCADPERPWTWREGKERGGLGVMGDMGCHMISVIHALMGPIAEVSGLVQTTVPVRLSPDGPRQVENEDSALAMMKFENGAIGSFATSRVAIGRKCRLQVEVHGTTGSIVFDQENMNELWVCKFGDEGFTRIVTGPDQPDFGAFCPGPGHNFGFNEMKVIEARNLVSAISGGPACGPDFAEGLTIEKTIFAIAESHGTWTRI
jgi:predicted dehydrogenase